MTHAERLQSAFATAAKRPGAIVYVYRPASPTGKSRQGAYSPFGVKRNGDMKIKIASRRAAANLAAMGYFPAKAPAPAPAGVKKAAVKTEKLEADEQAEI